jgi:hypothetical protein
MFVILRFGPMIYDIFWPSLVLVFGPIIYPTVWSNDL